VLRLVKADEFLEMEDTDSKRVEIRISLTLPVIIDKTLNAFNKWKPGRRHSQKLSITNASQGDAQDPSPIQNNPSRLPIEIYEHILAAVGYDILLVPLQLDRLKNRGHFLEYFRFVEFKVRARNQTLRNCRLVSTVWNDIATKHLNTYLVIPNETWKDHVIWRSEEVFRRQVRHVWITPSADTEYRIHPNPWQGLFSRIFTGFPNLETLYASFEQCYDRFYTEQFRRFHVPPNLRILGLDGPVVRGMANSVIADVQLHVLKLFPRLETFIEVGGSRDDILIINGNVHDVSCSSIKMSFSQPLTKPYFSRIQSLSLTGGHFVQDQSIVLFASLCPPIRSLHICGFDCSFTMRGTRPINQILTNRSGTTFGGSRSRTRITATRNSTKRTTLG
jgi:hypothetical protein